MQLIFATGNLGKLKEVKKIFNHDKFDIISPSELGKMPEIEENGSTFEDNAFLKASAIYELYKKPVIADDSGLAVEHLNGQPGVYSARFAGENCTYEDNNIKLLKELKRFDSPYPAKFVCSAVYFDGINKIVEFGELFGQIIESHRGENGFGYDPIFQPDGYNETLAEMDLELKNSISHRGRAFNKLKTKLIEKVIK